MKCFFSFSSQGIAYAFRPAYQNIELNRKDKRAGVKFCDDWETGFSEKFLHTKADYCTILTLESDPRCLPYPNEMMGPPTLHHHRNSIFLYDRPESVSAVLLLNEEGLLVYSLRTIVSYEDNKG